MTSRIGIWELKNRASEIVHEVQERKAEYVVTLRGEPVAILLPFPQEAKRLAPDSTGRGAP